MRSGTEIANSLNSDERKRLLKQLAEDDLFVFAKIILQYPDLDWPTHGEICEALQSQKRKKLIVVPRGCLKSTLASVAFPIWLLCKNPNLRILLDSELYKNSRTFLREIKAQLQGNELLKEVWGDFKTDSNWTEAEITIKQRTKAFKESSISCSGIDTEKTGQHYDVAILDDMNGPSNSITEEGRQKVIDHYRMFMSLLEPETSQIVIVGTRYHQKDLIGFILENELGKQSDGSDINARTERASDRLPGLL